MNQIVFLLFYYFVFILSLSAGPFRIEDASYFPDIQEILKRKKLIVAIHQDLNSAPFIFNNKGKLIGCDIDLAHMIAKALGDDITVEFLCSAETYDELVSQVIDGEADIAISNISYTIERSKHVFYADPPYITLYVGLLIDRSELEKISDKVSVSDLFSQERQSKICVLEGSSYQTLVKEIFPFAQIVLEKTTDNMLKSLKEKKCIAIINDSVEIRSTLLREPKLNLHYQSILLKDKTDPNYVVVSPKRPGLLAFINQFLSHHPEARTTLEKIYQQYGKFVI